MKIGTFGKTLWLIICGFAWQLTIEKSIFNLYLQFVPGPFQQSNIIIKLRKDKDSEFTGLFSIFDFFDQSISQTNVFSRLLKIGLVHEKFDKITSNSSSIFIQQFLVEQVNHLRMFCCSLKLWSGHLSSHCQKLPWFQDQSVIFRFTTRFQAFQLWLE